MSSDIWTRCGASSELRPLLLRPCRAVEAQRVWSTRKLVDSWAEAELLEELLSRSERLAFPSPEEEGLHELLSEPLRQPPLPHGSRFGKTTEMGLWYASESERTAFAEIAYYRLLFLAGTSADLGPVKVELVTFRVPVSSDRGIDLTRPPFDAWRQVLASKTDYAATQALGSAMRRDGVEVFRYVSARDVEGGVNVGLFTARAFAAAQPRQFRTWTAVTTRSGVELVLNHPLRRKRNVFPREDFEVDGALPEPAV